MDVFFGILELGLESLVEIASWKLWHYSDREQTKRRRLRNMQIVRAGRQKLEVESVG